MLRLAPSPPSLIRQCPRIHAARPRPSSSRYISTSFSRRADLAPERPTEEEAAALEANRNAAKAPPEKKPLKDSNVFDMVDDGEGAKGPRTFKEFLDQVGAQFKHADTRKFLGGKIPFPMNPSFRPPPPLSDGLKERMYNEFIQNPERNSVRALSQRYHISLKRVDAILRLKGMEDAWKKGKQIQTGFQKGMDELLGAKKYNASMDSLQVDVDRTDVHEADTLEHDENRDASRQRYQRLYWESMNEGGEEPIVPGSLEHAKALAKRFTALGERIKMDPKLVPRVQDTKYMKRPSKVVTATRPGRPTMQFVDVGAKFMDVNDRVKRIAISERRARHRAQKHA